MADELFEGFAAREMTLGKAIVRSTGVKNANEQRLETLRQALEKAGELDTV